MITIAPCFGCVPPAGLSKVSHCKRNQDWIPARGRRNQRRACDQASGWPKGNYRGYYMTCCPQCELNYLESPQPQGCPVCKRKK